MRRRERECKGRSENAKEGARMQKGGARMQRREQECEGGSNNEKEGARMRGSENARERE